MDAESARLLRTARIAIAVLIAGLVVSGVTAFPLPQETAVLTPVVARTPLPALLPWLLPWLGTITAALAEVQRAHPYLLYGTDWLAFAHLVIAAAFVGPYRDPVRNVFVLRWGVLACAGVIPLALVAGAVRGIPFGWQLIDMSFGVVGVVPLLVAIRATARLESLAPVRS